VTPAWINSDHWFKELMNAGAMADVLQLMRLTLVNIKLLSVSQLMLFVWGTIEPDLH